MGCVDGGAGCSDRSQRMSSLSATLERGHNVPNIAAVLGFRARRQDKVHRQSTRHSM